MLILGGVVTLLATTAVRALIQPGESNWLTTDLGTHGTAGSFSYNSSTGVSTIQSTGDGLGGTSDGAFFLYEALGIGEGITAKLDAAPSGALGDEIAGLCVRSGAAADAASAFLGAKEDGSVVFQWRPASAVAAREYSLSQVTDTDWLRLVADESSIHAYYSTNGTSWTPLLGVEMDLTAAYGGVIISSGDTSQTATADFTDVERGAIGLRRKFVLDEDGATQTGSWNSRTAASDEYLQGNDYVDDDGITKGSGEISFAPQIPITGNYEVYARWSEGVDRDTDVGFEVGNPTSQTDSISVDQQAGGELWIYLGRYDLTSGGSAQYVSVSNTGTTDLVTIDAIKWLGTGWTDTDTDGLPDPWETAQFGNLTSYNGSDDPDGDNLDNLGEVFNGTDPNLVDTDSDSAPDDWEVQYGFDPLDGADGLVDTDSDGLPDWRELYTDGLNPDDETDALSDADGDQIPNLYEWNLGTDLADSASYPAPTTIVDSAQGGVSGSDNIYSTLAEAISAVPSSGWPIVRVASGTYYENLTLSKRVAVLGETGGLPPRIAGVGSGYPLNVYNNHDGYVVSGFIIEPDSPGTSSGVRVSLSSGKRVHLSNCLIRGNSASRGAGIDLYRGEVVIEHSTITGNSATNSGDAIYIGNGQGSVRLRNSILWNPEGASDDELSGVTSILTVENSIIRSGDAGGDATDPGMHSTGYLIGSSAAIGMGIAGFGPHTDIHGEVRDSEPDLGFDEWSNTDTDSDGIVDGEEISIYLTDPNDSDSDDDGLSDYAEVFTYSTDPNVTDTDGDGEDDGYEVTNGTSAINPTSFSIDTDTDSLPDNWETNHFGNLTSQISTGDPDGDGLDNAGELLAGTDPNDVDTDSDTASDEWEVANGYDPLDGADGLVDTDGDELPDWRETNVPGLDKDNDWDALSDADGDQVPNLYEFKVGTDPSDPQDFPAPTAIVDQALGGNSGSDNIYATITEAINAVPSGSWPTIEVRAGTYNERAYITKRVALLGVPGDTLPRIAGPGSLNPVYVTSSGNESVLNNLEIHCADDASTPKSGIRAQMGSSQRRLAITNCLIRGNSDSYGAGIYVYRSKVLIEHCTMIDNDATTAGNAIYLSTSTLALIRNSVIWNSSGTAPTEITGSTSSLTIEDSIITGGELGASGTDPGLTTDGFILLNSGARDLSQSIAWQSADFQGEARDSTPDAGYDELLMTDTDGDGLIDREEELVHQTDPNDADSDDDGLSDGQEITLGTDANLSDTDGDGLPDGWENQYGLDPLTQGTDATDDADGDGLSNSAEYTAGTNPLESDSDGDGLTDNAEINTHSTDPLDTDTDGDGLPDGWEVTHSLNPNAQGTDATDDLDSDGLNNTEEYTHGTDPNDSDTDDDGLNDGAEVNTHSTSPLLADSDGDGLSDHQEITVELTNPNLIDTDGDGLGDGYEVATSTDPLTAQSSGSGSPGPTGLEVYTPIHRSLN